MADTVSERLQNVFNDKQTPSLEEEFLHPDMAFRFSASADLPGQADLFWQIADGYYLYRDKFSFNVIQGSAILIEDRINLPHGELKEDELFGSVEVNKGEINVALSFSTALDEEPITLQVKYQGCKEDAICYPPVVKEVLLNLSTTSTIDE